MQLTSKRNSWFVALEVLAAGNVRVPQMSPCKHTHGEKWQNDNRIVKGFSKKRCQSFPLLWKFSENDPDKFPGIAGSFRWIRLGHQPITGKSTRQAHGQECFWRWVNSQD